MKWIFFTSLVAGEQCQPNLLLRDAARAKQPISLHLQSFSQPYWRTHTQVHQTPEGPLQQERYAKVNHITHMRSIRNLLKRWLSFEGNASCFSVGYRNAGFASKKVGDWYVWWPTIVRLVKRLMIDDNRKAQWSLYLLSKVDEVRDPKERQELSHPHENRATETPITLRSRLTIYLSISWTPTRRRPPSAWLKPIHIHEASTVEGILTKPARGYPYRQHT